VLDYGSVSYEMIYQSAQCSSPRRLIYLRSPDTVQTTLSSRTNLDRNSPHARTVYVMPQNHTPNNNLSLLIFYTYRCFII
jgi:hypothetical protein